MTKVIAKLKTNKNQHTKPDNSSSGHHRPLAHKIDGTGAKSIPSGPTVGAEIRRRRVEQGLTLAHLAESARVHPSFLSKVEKDRVDVGLPVLQRIASALGIQPGELFGPLPQISRKAIEVGHLFDHASSELQRAVLEILRAVIRQVQATKPARKRPAR